VLPAVRQALRGISGDLLIENESSFNAIVSDSVALQRAQSAFAVFVGALAAVVAGVGLYGVMTFGIASRRRELGIRLALGSNPARLFRETLAGGIRLAAIGLVLGTVAAAGAVRALSTRVFGLSAADPVAYAAAALLVMLVAVAAIWIPARRVMRTDPLIALRAE
jgi:ABC-type antimicrobial peptide transport system permease subunit